MKNEKLGEELSRRSFLKAVAASAAAGFLAEGATVLFPRSAAHAAPADGTAKSLIVRVHSDRVWRTRRRPEKDVVQAMLSRGIREFTGKDTDEEAWGSLFSPDDVVGIKLSALGGPMLCTNRELVDSIVEGLLSAGLRENNIILWERFMTDLPTLGLKKNTGRKGVRCYTSEVYNGRGGRGYDNEVFIEQNGVRARVTKIITKDTTAIINVPVLKDHGGAGITNTLKNFAFGSIDRTRELHGNGCDPAIADACALPVMRRRLRLCIVDALRCLYEGGPVDRPMHKWQQNELHIGADMVALDTIGWNIIEKKRTEKRLPSLKEAGREPVHIFTAEKRGLGTMKKEKMEIRTVRT